MADTVKALAAAAAERAEGIDYQATTLSNAAGATAADLAANLKAAKSIHSSVGYLANTTQKLVNAALAASVPATPTTPQPVEPPPVTPPAASNKLL